MDKKISIDFSPIINFICEPISFYTSNITLNHLNLKGSLKFYNCQVKIKNSKIVRSEFEDDVILLTELHTELKAINVSIHACGIISSVIFQNSSAQFINCKFKNSICSLYVEEESKCVVIRSKFVNSNNVENSQSISLDHGSTLTAFDCTFSKDSYHSIVSNNNSNLNLIGCNFSQCNQSFIQCKSQTEFFIQNCSFDSVSTEYTGIFLKQSRGKVLSSLFKSKSPISLLTEDHSNVQIDSSIFECGEFSIMFYKFRFIW